MKRLTICLMVVTLEVFALLGFPTFTAAQSPTNPYHEEIFSLDSGTYDGQNQQSYVAFQEVIRFENARWVRLQFSEYNLGRQSYLTITSLLDGGQQRFDAQSLPEWNSASAVFNGEAVEIKLHVAHQDRDIFFRIDKIVVGDPIPDEPVFAPQTLCGPDNRIASTDKRVGRIFYGSGVHDCTVWLTSSGALLTAGHCVDFDPDRQGPGLPDGNLDLTGLIEFDVPSSTISGTVVAAAPNDQYPIVITPTTSVVWNFDGIGQGLGKDWAVFRVNRNSNTRLTPYQAQNGFFRMTRANPAISDTIRITGFGIDVTPPGPTGGGNAQHKTNQTSTGDYVEERISGNDVWHRYQVDTTGANSGSPIIWPNNEFAVGIHTNAGCQDPVANSANNGTSFEHNPLEQALQDFRYGNGTVYVDREFPASMLPDGVRTRDGTIFRPFLTVTEGVNSVDADGTVSIVAGSYNETLTVNQPITLTASVLPVTIGSP